MSTKKILLVDDMGGVRRSVAHLLRQAGHEVTEAQDGIEALRLLGTTSYDLVITDILMPGKDGSEVINWLHGQIRHPRIIAMSGGGANSTAVQAIAVARDKADAILLKPFGRNELMGAVSRTLGEDAA